MEGLITSGFSANVAVTRRSAAHRPSFVRIIRRPDSAATAAPATACATGKKSAKRFATTSPTSSPRNRSSARTRNRIIKVPIRGVKEYRFVYGDNAPGVGQGGDGEPKPGDVVGQGKDGKGGQQAGDRPGIDYYETDVSLDELVDLMFEDLELPDLERKRLRQIEVERCSAKKDFAAKASACGWTRSAPRARASSARRRR